MGKKKNFILWFGMFAILYLIFSFATYKDYGITADEEIEAKSGNALLNYFKTGENPQNSGLAERQLPTNSMYLRVYPALLTLINFKGFFEWYHLLNMLFSLILFGAFYTFIYLELKKPSLAFLGTLTLFITPRVLGDIPTNQKDIPFACTYLLSLLLIYFFSTKRAPQKIKLLILGIIFGLTWGFRLIGLSIFVVYFIYTLFLLEKKTPVEIAKIAKNTFVLFIISMLPLFLLWPFFRINFPQSLYTLILNAKSFEYWDRTILFMGKFLSKTERPSSYLPIWILITTPLYILIPFVLSWFSYIKTRRKIYILCLTAITANLILYFVVNPTIYNGIRHFIFLLPIITLISFISFLDILDYLKTKNKLLVTSLFVAWACGLLLTARTMILLHPYEYVYFNELIGGLKGAQGQFEMDYWFASNKESSEWLSQNVPEKPLQKVYPCNTAVSVRYFSQAKFDLVGKIAEADYIICDYETALHSKLNYPVIHTVERMGVPLSTVRKVWNN